MKLFLIAALIAVAAAAPSAPYKPTGYGQPHITIVKQSDERQGVMSSQWSFEGSDGTTRQESNAEKQISGYGKSEGYGDNYNSGNTNQGSTYWISPEGERVSLSWTADERGVIASGSHLPVAPALPYNRVDGHGKPY